MQIKTTSGLVIRTSSENVVASCVKPPKPTFNCTICGTTFATKKALTGHLQLSSCRAVAAKDQRLAKQRLSGTGTVEAKAAKKARDASVAETNLANLQFSLVANARTRVRLRKVETSSWMQGGRDAKAKTEDGRKLNKGMGARPGQYTAEQNSATSKTANTG